MKKLLLYLLLALSLSANAQVNKKLIHFMMAGGGSSTPPSTALTNFTFDVDIIQYTDEPIVLNATPVGILPVLSATWEVRYKDGTLAGFAATRSANITTVTDNGFYDLTFTAKTATDQYTKTWTDIYVDDPRFERAEADLIIDLSDGDYYNNFGGGDNSGLKIYVENSGVAQIQFTGLFGSENDPVRVQKANDNTDITQTRPDGIPHTIYLFANNEWIRFNGFNVDKTIGWNVVGDDGGGAQLIAAKDGAFTGIQFFGMNTVHSYGSHSATFSFIPTTSATYNAATYVGEKLVVWGCNITDAGDEGIYMGYNSDALQSTYRPIKYYGCVISWNVINSSGRDGIQPGGCEVIISNNTIRNWGQQHDTSHESALSLNGGSYGIVHSNYMRGGEMWANIQSGEVPFNLSLGESTPRGWKIYGNDYADSVYTAGGSTEAFAVYVQTSIVETATSNWPIEFYNNTVRTDKKFMEVYFHADSWTMTGFKFVNNVIVKVGNAGDTQEANYTGAGTQPTGTTQNNLVRNHGSESDILFTDYANYDLTISSFSSPVYTGATDVSSYEGQLDYDGYPMDADGYAYGAYSGYNKKTITPNTGDPDAATFTDPVAIGDLTQEGGTITFEADKQGVLYWTVVANNATAPTISEIVSGSGIVSGSILDAGTANEGDITGLSLGTAYDHYSIFVTVDGVYQASATKVDFTTTADVVAPTISTFVINDANKDRIYFSSSEVITASTVSGFTVATPTKTISSVTINSGQTTGHYFTVSVPFVYGETPTLAYSGSGSNLVDGSANALASFGATSITNNIAAGAAEPVIGYLNDDITVSGVNNNTFTATTTSADIESQQIIPAASNGYVQYTWDEATRTTSYKAVGFIAEADNNPTHTDIKLHLELQPANHNIDIYVNGVYTTTFSTAGYQEATTKYRIFIDRATQKISALASNNDFASSVTMYTTTATFTGDFRFVFYSTVNGGVAKDCYIQADLGLN